MDKELLFTFAKAAGIDHNYVWLRKIPGGDLYIEYALSNDKIEKCSSKYFYWVSCFNEPKADLQKYIGKLFSCSEHTCNGACKIGDGDCGICPKTNQKVSPNGLCSRYVITLVDFNNNNLASSIEAVNNLVDEKNIEDHKFPFFLKAGDLINVFKCLEDYFLYNT